MATKMLQRGQAIVARPAVKAVERRAIQSLTSLSSSSMDNVFPMFQNTSMPTTQNKVTTWPTALKEIPVATNTKPTTPMMQVMPNLYAKLEGFNAGGSIKDRAVMQCTMGMFESGKLKSGDTLCVSTSGNAGRSLLHVQDQLKKKGITLHVKIFMPKRYLSRDVPTVIAQTDSVETVAGDKDAYSRMQDSTSTRFLFGLDGEFMECQQKMSVLAEEHGWAVLDQHYDVNSLHAHQSTAEEIIHQLPSVTDVVCTVGTGGTASGLRKYLPSNVAVHARPAKPGDIDGITDVRRYSNFCDPDLLEGYTNNFFDASESTAHQNELETDHRITAGQSSGAAFALAKEIMSKNPNAKVAFICADGVASPLALLESQTIGDLRVE